MNPYVFCWLFQAGLLPHFPRGSVLVLLAARRAAVVEVREVLATPRSARPSTPPSAVVVGLEALAAVALGVSSSLAISIASVFPPVASRPCLQVVESLAAPHWAACSSPRQVAVGAEALGTDRWLWAPSARAPQGSSPLPEFPRPYSTARRAFQSNLEQPLQKRALINPAPVSKQPGQPPRAAFVCGVVAPAVGRLRKPPPPVRRPPQRWLWVQACEVGSAPVHDTAPRPGQG